METAYQIVFFGEILPGRDAEAARGELAAMFKLDPERTLRVFSGKRVVLKKGLNPERAMQYRQRFEAMGLRVRLEAVPVPVPVDAPAGAPPVPIRPRSSGRGSAHPSWSAGGVAQPDGPSPEPSPAADEVICPQCGELQPPRTLCRACAVDMPRFAAAQRAREVEAHAPPPAAARPAAPSSEGRVLPSGVLGTDFSGRLGRRSYLLGGLLVTLAGLWGLSMVLKLESLLILLLVAALAIFLSVRLGVLRCHDLGWSGWWSALGLVPYVGGVFSLLLLILPGRSEEGPYGSRGEPASVKAILGTLVLLALTMITVMNQVVGSAHRLPAMLGMDVPGLPSLAAGRSSAAAGAYDPARDRIVMYSLTTCGYCAAKRQEFDAAGMTYSEYFVDQDQGAAQALNEKLLASGHRGGGVGTPIIEVNGVLLPNNPPMEAISRHFHGAT